MWSNLAQMTVKKRNVNQNFRAMSQFKVPCTARAGSAQQTKLRQSEARPASMLKLGWISGSLSRKGQEYLYRSIKALEYGEHGTYSQRSRKSISNQISDHPARSGGLNRFNGINRTWGKGPIAKLRSVPSRMGIACGASDPAMVSSKPSRSCGVFPKGESGSIGNIDFYLRAMH
jgi:hypothetical protein